MATGYLDLAEVVQVTMFAFEVQDSQIVVLVQVVGLGVVIVEYWYFGQAIVEVLSTGLQIDNSPGMVSIGSTCSAIGYSIGQARMVGNFEAVEVVDCFAQHYSSQVDIVEDLGDYSFAIDYHMNLNFAMDSEVYLDVGPMAIIEQ